MLSLSLRYPVSFRAISNAFNHEVYEVSIKSDNDHECYFSDNKVYLKILEVKKIKLERPITVYNLEVEHDNSYLVPPLTVHNCEPFTAANPMRYPDPLDRLYRDPIGRLTLEFIRLVGELKPKIFVMENVPAIMDNGLKQALTSEFRSVGYDKIHFNILRAEEYGVPSHRVRVFISNIKLELKKVKKRIKVIEALSNLPEPGSDQVPNHDLLELSPRKLRKISRVRWGKSLYLYEGAEGKRYPNYIRLDPYDIAPTVLGSSRFIHPFETRLLTVREQARLMGFPDDHVFVGGRDQQYNQVGEAVPPPLAKAIAKYILRFIT